MQCNLNYKSIVFHGLYRLQPIHIRLFKELENAGYEVILLNCYNGEYKRTYSFWIDLYKSLINLFNITNRNIKMDKVDGVNHRSIGTIIGNLIEGKDTEGCFLIGRSSIGQDLNVDVSDIKEIFKNDQKYSIKELLGMEKKCPQYADTIKGIIAHLIKKSNLFVKYNSTMQFVECVSGIFDQTMSGQGKHKISAMKEQFYGAKGTEMNNIFQVFYPDEFGVKPFLSYPIGQFILALYNMWDVSNNQLILNNIDLMECLNLDVWKGISPNMVYEKVKAYIGLEKENTGLTIDEFLHRIDKLAEKQRIKSDWVEDKLDNLSFFYINENKYKEFKNVINNIDKIAKKIFLDTKKQTSKDHYVNMIKVINEEKEWKKLSSEEKKIIDEIDVRLNRISDEEEKTDLDTVRDTLTFYLSNSIGSDINWLVRDLDQIEGDILSEAARAKKCKLQEKCYHYSMLSNENMTESDLQELPWPLTKEFVVSKEKAELFHIINRNNVKYKRCLLFQGLYYLIDNPLIKLKLSYIEYENDRKYTPYYLINHLMNIIDYSDKDHFYNNLIEQVSLPILINEKWNIKAKKVMLCCQKKFMYSYGLDNPSEQYNNEIQVKNVLWKAYTIMDLQVLGQT
ncbi:hypothetical protein ACTFJW_08980 [Clostridium cagae]|uniref:hypothetical protein n=1 Tax=Clostridium cagae TaxID=2080751 RepID=UPI003F76205A